LGPRLEKCSSGKKNVGPVKAKKETFLGTRGVQKKRDRPQSTPETPERGPRKTTK